MERESTDSEILENFYCKDPKKIFGKINRFTKSGTKCLHLVADFDRTLTLGKNNDGENVSTWELLRRYLSPESQEIYQQLYDIYRSKEIQGSMTLPDAITWWESILKLYKHDRLKWADIDYEVHTRMPIRPYAFDLFQTCQEHSIPTVIISAGLKDVISLWCQKHGIYPTTVLSTKLTFSPDGCIGGWEKKSLVHTLNKHEKGHKEIIRIRLERPHTILIGDSISDASMVAGENNIIRILVNDPRHDDKVTDLTQVPPAFDLMTKDHTLLGLLKIILQLITS